MKVIIRLIVFIGLATQLNAQDLTVPELVSFNVTPQIVDITNGPAQVTVTMGATDDISGVASINPKLLLPNGNNSNKNSTLVSGTNLNGTWEATFTIPQFTLTGTATIIGIVFFRDIAGNQTSITETELINSG